MDTRSVAFALLCTVLAVCAQPYDGGILRPPGDYFEDRPRGLEREFASGLERESVGGYPGGYRDRGPQRFPASASESYPGRRPGRLPSRDVYPGGLPGGTSPTLCGGRICPIGSRCVSQRNSCVRKPCYPTKTCVS
uniref:TIL domain containing protein n=1 Tax=Rhipicephalus zambeziensis TaxID=60191 RepID=A0A224YPK0_9ACAR